MMTDFPDPDRLLYAGGWPFSGPPRAGRSCGSCQFCCTHVPVEAPLNKPQGVRCQFLRSKGCGVYANRPHVCRYWSCAWLFQPDAHGLKRPDISGYAVDPMVQEVLIDAKPMPAIQVYLDPARPHAHRAPELRAFLQDMAVKHGFGAIARTSNNIGDEAIFLGAPGLTGEDEWLERSSFMTSHYELQMKKEK